MADSKVTVKMRVMSPLMARNEQEPSPPLSLELEFVTRDHSSQEQRSSFEFRVDLKDKEQPADKRQLSSSEGTLGRNKTRPASDGTLSSLV
jgi:hypothetical protein